MSVSRRTKVGEERLSINSKCDPMGKSFKSKRKAKMATALKDNMNNSDVPDDWMERDEEEEDNNEDEDEVQQCPPVHFKHQTMLLQKESDSEDFFIFPWDFWHTLSNYIIPENVGKFASICKTTYSIVATQTFWRRLYKRYFNPFLHSDLPVRLQPDCMSRPRGLRPSVIQMLHLTHPPFLDNHSRQSAVWPDPHSLTG